MAPRDYLPVTYETETNLPSELLKVAPTLLLIGFWIFMMRSSGGLGGMMGGGGGGGGGRNIFQVSRSADCHHATRPRPRRLPQLT